MTEEKKPNKVRIMLMTPDGRTSKKGEFDCVPDNCHICESLFGQCMKRQAEGNVFGG